MWAVKEGHTWLAKAELINERCAFPREGDLEPAPDASAKQRSVQRAPLQAQPPQHPAAVSSVPTPRAVWQYLVTGYTQTGWGRSSPGTNSEVLKGTCVEMSTAVPRVVMCKVSVRRGAGKNTVVATN